MITQFPEYLFENPRYPFPRLSAELVVMTVRDGALEVLMVPAGDKDRRGELVFPGTFLIEEKAFERVAQDLAEELGLRPSPAEQIGVFSAPQRDPRGWVVTTAFLIALDCATFDYCVDGRAECHVVSVRVDKDDTWASLSLYDRRVITTSDQAAIIAAAVRHLRDRLDSTRLPFRFLGENFTLLELLQVHEAISGTSLNKSNFRKRMLASTWPGGMQLIPAKLRKPGPHRPAAVFYLGKG